TATSHVVSIVGPWSAVDTDLLILPWFQDEPASAVAGVDAASGGEVARALSSKEFQAKPYDLFFAPVSDRSWTPRRIALVGGGAGERGTELVRRLATAAGLAARGKRVARAAFVVRGQGDGPALARAISEGLTLAEFYAGSYKTGDPPPAPPPAWTIVVADGDTRAVDAAAEAAARGRVLGESTNLARELANEPGNTLTPREFAR